MSDDAIKLIIANWPMLLSTLVIVILQLRNGWNSTANKKELKGEIVATQGSVDKLERQINSNLEKQIEASIAKAIANERLRVAGIPANDPMTQERVQAEATADVNKAQAKK